MSDDLSADLPPSAKFVYYVLETEGELTRSELAETSGLPDRTVRRGLDELTDAGMVDHRHDPTDPQAKVFRIDDTIE